MLGSMRRSKQGAFGVRAGSDPRVTTGRSAAAKQRGTYRIHKKRHLQGPQEIELARDYLLRWEVA